MRWMFIGLNLFHGNQFAQACEKLMQLQKSFDNLSKTRKHKTMKVLYQRLPWKAFKQRAGDMSKVLIPLLIEKVQGKAIDLDSSIFPLPVNSTSVQPLLLPEREKQNHEVEKRLWRQNDKVLSWSLYDRSTASSLPETTFEKANGPWGFITIGCLILICLPHLIILLCLFILEKFSNNNIVNYNFLYEVQGIIGTANDISTYSFHQGCCTVVVNTAFVCR